MCWGGGEAGCSTFLQTADCTRGAGTAVPAQATDRLDCVCFTTQLLLSAAMTKFLLCPILSGFKWILESF